MELSMSAQHRNRQSLVRIAGDLDLVTARPLEEFLSQVLNNGSARVVVDLAAVTFMDCSALGVMLRARKASVSRGGALRLVALPRRVRALLVLTGTQALARSAPFAPC
jgi:anti-sigma B factor antagonist